MLARSIEPACRGKQIALAWYLETFPFSTFQSGACNEEDGGHTCLVCFRMGPQLASGLVGNRVALSILD